MTIRRPSGTARRSNEQDDAHARAHGLLARRCDAPLEPLDEAWVAAHLASCPSCDAAARADDEARAALRALPPRHPPRDLGARVAAALDREIAADRGGGSRPAVGRPTSPPVLVALAAAGVGVALLVAGGRLLLSLPTPDEPGSTGAAAIPTPFAVPGAELAFVDVEGDGLAVYQAAVSQVCPPPTVDCDAAVYQSRRMVDIPADLTPRGLALDRVGRRLALVAEDAVGEDSVSVLVLPPLEIAGVDVPRGAGPGPDGLWLPRMSPRSTPSPGAAPGTWHADDREQGPSPPAGAPSLSPDPSPRSAPSSWPDTSPSPAPSSSPDPDARPSRLLAIIDDVQAVGAPPAWSRDGTVLAFSAMPADRSHGPDVYIWRPGDARAHRLTSDHRTWFASWAGDRIVASRVATEPPRRGARTVLIDPATGDDVVTTLAGAWLPSVDPTGRFAVAWHGDLVATGLTVRPRSGGLALLDWSVVAPGASLETAPADSPGSAESVGGRTAALPGVYRPTGRARAGLPAARPGTVDGTTNGSGATGSPWLEAVEPSGVPGSAAVRDWQVRWAEQGTTFGYWVADSNGADWGRLTVVRVVPSTMSIDREDTILGPTLARRSFSLGVDRVAWVAPVDEGTDGELRVRTWGAPGEGGLRIRDLELREGVPAF